MSTVTQEVNMTRLFWDDLKRHDYSDEDIAFTVAEMFKPKNPESRRIPHQRFYDRLELHATFTVEPHPEKDRLIRITYQWDDTTSSRAGDDS
jgi:hypothetical protein